MKRALAVALVLAAAPVAADEGELYLGAAAAVEAATLQHPLSPRASQLSPLSGIPRLIINARYGVTNEAHVGLGIEAAGTANVITDGVVIGGKNAQLVTGTYLEVAAPARAAWRFDSGYDFTAEGAVDVAPMLALWSATAATDPSQVNDSGLARRLPFEVADTLTSGLQIRLSLAFDARLFGSLGIRVGAYAGAAWVGSASLRAGVLIEPSWIVSPGPR